MSALNFIGVLNRIKEQGHQLDVFYDIGASIGRWTQLTQDIFPDAHYHLFEPLAGRLDVIDRHSLLPNLRNADLHPIALSDENGEGEIKVLGPGGVGSSILVLPSDRKKDIKIISCEMARLDDYVTQKKLKQPDFIKLDTQASELKVLMGAVETIRDVKFILLETWMWRVYGPGTPLFHEISSWLYQHDFVLYEILIPEVGGRSDDGSLRWFDAVYINKSASKIAVTLL